jgi:helicase
MKIKNLKNYGIPSYILNIWEKHYSPYLLPLQEEAVKNYGILNCNGSMGLPRRDAPRNDNIDSRFRGNDINGGGNDINGGGNDRAGRMNPTPTGGMDSRVRGNNKGNNNLLVIAPTSSGKSFIGEMAALSQVIHPKKIIYLVPSKSPAEEKYRHFKNLYNNLGADTVISTRNHREEDYRIIGGTYKIAVMAYEKFNYFLLKYPEFLDDVSLVIIDEMQAINHPKWGPLLEDIIEQLHKKDLAHLKIIGLSAFIENQKALLKWFPIQTRTLLSYQYPVKLHKGIVRDGTFEYITSNKKNICICRKEIFFKPKSVRDNCFEDYLLETLKYLINQGESTLIFFATPAETRHWAKWLASQLKSPATSPASSALKDLIKMEETLSRDELIKPLEKGIAFYNQDLSYEEKNLIETYLKKGEIKIICATTTLSMDINLPFKNVIIPLDKMHDNDNDEDYLRNYRTKSC